MRGALAAALDRAGQYVRVHGEPFDQDRLAALTGRAVDVAAPIPLPQNPDGGWAAPWSGGWSSLDATCRQLDLLSDLPGPVPGVDRAAAFAFIRQAQGVDGAWSEGPSDTTPDRLMPGSPPAVAYMTAHCARTLLRLDPGLAEVELAARLLEAWVDPRGRLPGEPSTHWLAARVLRDTGRALAARRLLDVVGRGFESFDAVDLAWFGSDVAVGDRWVARIAAHLVSVQNADGSWNGEGGVPDAALTVTACRTLVRG
jgi:hypothetical protein